MDSKYNLITAKSAPVTNQTKFTVKRKLQNVSTHNSLKEQKKNKHVKLTHNEKEYIDPKKDLPNKQLCLEAQRNALPIFKCRKLLMKFFKKMDTMLIMGETGSGKTTQIPQFLLEGGFSQGGIIGVTQPRRVAAITIAKRVAAEQNTRVGDKVGYRVRFEDCTSNKTRLQYITDGSLLREALNDNLLMKYAVIILDEAHERTVNTDVILGLVKDAQRQRVLRNLMPLKIIITSATMDIDHFGKFFKVRGMYLEGRMHPVRIYHAKEHQEDALHAALVTLFNYHRNSPANHDVLMFLTGQEEIEAIAKQIQQIAKFLESGMPILRVFQLYAQLPQNKQLECFISLPANHRKVVLATNIAETSITIPGIRCVIDCGFVKRKTYNPTSGLEMLKIRRISQAQAWQRCGRAGRDAPGVCYRTYTQTEMSTFEKMPKPEILRSNITSTVLELTAIGIDCNNFEFLDKPSSEAIDSAYSKLESLGAINFKSGSLQLTQLGKQMSQFPLDPNFSKLILSASSFGCLNEMLSLVAVLSAENIFITNSDKKELTSLTHAKFQSKFGDHLTLLNVYNSFEKAQKPKLWCHDNFLNSRNLFYARDVRNQLLEIAERLKLEVNSCGQNCDNVRKCLLTGFFQNIAILQDDKFYKTLCGKQRAKIHPSSIFHGRYQPEYIIFTEILLTERSFLKIVTEINPEWISEVLPNLPYLSRIKIK